MQIDSIWICPETPKCYAASGVTGYPILQHGAVVDVRSWGKFKRDMLMAGFVKRFRRRPTALAATLIIGPASETLHIY